MAKVTLEKVGPGNSFYSFTAKYSLEEASNPSAHRTFHRLCSLMRKMNVRTGIVEELDLNFPEIKEEIDAINIYHSGKTEFKLYRLTFVIRDVTDMSKIGTLVDSDFLASAILINYKNTEGTWRSYIYKAIVTIPKIYATADSPPLPLLNTYVHACNNFSCEVQTGESAPHKFNVTGTFFAQQNGTTSVCCHAALAACINNATFIKGPAITPEAINKILGIDHINSRFGRRDNEKKGLTVVEIDTFLKARNLNRLWFDFFSRPLVPYNQLIYNYIESGCPVLLGFTTESPHDLHVVAVLGHTLLSDIWRSEAEPVYSTFAERLEYKPASKWVDNFIIHDDNFGMNLCLPIDSLKRTTFPKYDPTFRASWAAVIIPETVKTQATEAEYASSVVTEDALKFRQTKGTLDPWCERLLNNPASKVIRTFLVSKEEYENGLKITDFDGKGFSHEDREALTKDLPALFWLAEITTIDLYCANKTKIIDFFYGCDHPLLKDENQVFSRWLQIRFPSVLITRDAPNKYAMKPLRVQSHYPLLKFKNQSDTLDW